MGPLQREWVKQLPETGDLGWTSKQLAGRGLASVVGTAGEISTMGALHGTTKTSHEYLPSLESTET